VARVQAAVTVLQQVQEFDQQVAAPFPVTEQRLHLLQSLRLDLPALGMIESAPPARARVDAAVVF
jgi:hypothetical protein